MPKELKKLMKKNKFTFLRQNNKIVWQHTSGVTMSTSATPSCNYYLNQIKRDIKRNIGKLVA